MPEDSKHYRQMGPAEPNAGEAEPSEPAEAVQQWSPEDEFDPRYCIRCHRRIPIAVSERQGACDDCLDILDHLGSTPISPNPAAYGVGPYGSSHPICPKCGGGNVVREWVTDWLSTAVDIASGGSLLARGAAPTAQALYTPFGSVPRVDTTPDEAHTVKTMRHKCADCGFHWKAV
ncbi:MAG TPA: hypothetical protein VGM37_18630 [Armatimonadota bacterium]